MTNILYDARWVGDHGIGRFAGELQKLLPGLTPFYAHRRPSHPLDAILLGAALRRKAPRLFFSPGYNSPVGWPGAFGFTLHDLHHLYVPANTLKRAYYRYVIKPACHRAAFVLTVSEYSKREIADAIPAGRAGRAARLGFPGRQLGGQAPPPETSAGRQ